MHGLDPKIINDFAARHGCIIGTCSAEPLARELYEAAGFVPFVSRDLEKRTDPSKTLAGVRGIVVIGCGAECVPVSEGADDDEKYGEISSLGLDTNYHIRVKGLLHALAEELRKKYDFQYKILVDSPALDERAFAVRAGLGFYGRHGLVISRKFGSRFNIGLLLTDIPLQSTAVEGEKCPPACRRCIDACPTNALAPNQRLDASRCISYLTQKDTLTPEEEKLLGCHLYGCDICQDACPFNIPGKKTKINPADWLAMNDGDFKREYGHTAMLWKGAEILRRNARAVIKARATPSQP
jgi:epoxyqueuosine reductase